MTSRAVPPAAPETLTHHHTHAPAFVHRGGNVTITGLKVEAASSSSSTPASPALLKPRAAAFNGSLGFFTLGLSIEVLGLFELKRCAARGGSTGSGPSGRSTPVSHEGGQEA